MDKLLEALPGKIASQRLKQQIEFILEMDKLKGVMRRSPLLDKSRVENDAEHSWHLGMMVMVLGEYAGPDVNLSRVLRMVLLHDIVEIDAGDVFLYDKKHELAEKKEKEHKAAERLFGLLPDDLREELMGLWKEFDEHETPDAKFAYALDLLQPLLLNYFTEGGTWVQYNITLEQVLTGRGRIEKASTQLWEFVESLLQDAVNKGFLTA